LLVHNLTIGESSVRQYLQVMESAAAATQDERASPDEDAVPARRLRGRNIPTHPRRVQSALNKIEVLKLRAAGASWSDIADQLGFKSPKVAYNVCAKALKELPTAMDLAEERDLVAYRLDDVYARLNSGTVDAQTGGAMIRALTARMGLLGLRVPTEERVKHEGQIDHNHAHFAADDPRRPLTPEEKLDVAEQLSALVSTVASKHADAQVAVRMRQLGAATHTETTDGDVEIALVPEVRQA